MATAFEDLRVLKDVESIADNVWKYAYQWEPFIRDTIAKQIKRFAKSISQQNTSYKKIKETEATYNIEDTLFSHDDLNWLAEIGNNLQKLSETMHPISNSLISNSPKAERSDAPNLKRSNPYE